MKSILPTTLPFAILFAALPASAALVITYIDDNAGFQAQLPSGSDFGALPEDPGLGGSDTAVISTYSYTGNNGTSNYGFTFQEGAYDSFTNVGAPTLVTGIDTTGSGFIVEAGSVGQGGANIPAWGFDTDLTINSATNTVSLFDFTASANPVYSFSLDAADFEGGNASPNYVGVYDTSGNLISSQAFNWPAPNYGDGEVRNFALGSDMQIGYIALFVGEADATGSGYTERIAAGNFMVGSAILDSIAPPTGNVPEPSRALLLGIGLLTLLIRRQR